MRNIVRVSFGIAGAFLIAAPVLAQRLERTPEPAGEAKPQPYLTSAVSYESVLSKPPAEGSIEDGSDRHVVEELQNVTADRRQVATLDDEYVYPRFDDAFGRP